MQKTSIIHPRDRKEILAIWGIEYMRSDCYKFKVKKDKNNYMLLFFNIEITEAVLEFHPVLVQEIISLRGMTVWRISVIIGAVTLQQREIEGKVKV